ncbi:hypothetical protein GCM10009660_01260 [Catellatospora bangladeshensis]
MSAAVAVVGLACRFPGAPDADRYWANLSAGVESIRPVPGAGPGLVAWAPEFDGIELFDAEFFGYTAREAEITDPQQRLFLEAAWSALEHAGCDPARFPGRVGVFGGSGTNHYAHHVHSHPRLVETVGPTQVLLGNELGFLATRVSYKLGLTGPSLSLRTACSTALVALHLACRSLRDGECEMALSGGVYLDRGQQDGYRSPEGSFVSPDGHVRPFDADARGTVFGSGVGVVALKRLEDALADGDAVYAVVRGSAVNNDGAVKAGFTAPSATGQAAVIGAALDDAGLSPEDIDYVEAHGTGTALGDPVEVRALNLAYRGRGSCALGSVKGNIGHLDAAAGMAGLIKTVLALHHETLPATLNHRTPNPDVDLAGGPFRVQVERVPWPRVPGRPRRAGVSAFGFGGTNAHVILEEAPLRTTVRSGQETHTLVLSARTPEALEAATDRLADHLDRHSPDLADTAHTLATGRREFPHRRALTITTADPADAATALRERSSARTTTRHTTTDSPEVVFLFTGQGSQHVGMGEELYRTEPVYRDTVDHCADLLRPLLEHDIRDVMYKPNEHLHTTLYAQPALFTTEYALTRLWQHWGITPTTMIGHSLGEWVAATTADIFTLHDALTLITHRATLMHHQPPGAMLNIITTRHTLHLPPHTTLAAHNSPRDCVISGTTDDIDAYARTARRQGITTQPLATPHAYHHPTMASAAYQLRAQLRTTTLRPPSTPITSTTTATTLTPAQATDPDYWATQLTTTVEYNDAVANTTTPTTAYLEIGPGNTLATLTKRILGGAGNATIASLPRHDDPRGATETTRRALGALWTTGARPGWERVTGPGRRIALPGYAFQRKVFWLDRRAPVADGDTRGKRREDMAEWFAVPSWRQDPLPANPGPDTAKHWLVFTDGGGLGDALAGRLRAAGATVTTVAAGGTGPVVPGGRCTVDPGLAGDYDRLLTALRDGAGEAPTHVVHAWSADDPGDGPDAEETALRRGFGGLVLFAQAWSRAAGGARRLWVLTSGAHAVTGAERMRPLTATVLGPARVLPREVPGLACRVVDVEPGDPARADRVFTELGAEPDSGTREVALRGTRRWALHHIPHPLAPHDGPPPIRPGGVYLVTGGTGGLGLALTAHLAGAGAKVLVTARTPLPPEPEWAGSDNPAARELGRLRAGGAEVMFATADAADPVAMRAAVDAAARRWGGPHGAFHVAGVAGGGVIALKDLADAAAVLRPKVRGTLVLDRVLADRELDFLVLFGSNGANVANAGQADYCAANCFLDAFAQDRGRRGRVITVDWGSWKGVGMAVTTALPSGVEQARRRDVAERGMSVAEGLRALDTVLARATEPQVIVTPVPLADLLAEAAALRARAQERPAAARPRAAEPARAEQVVCAIWQELLGVERVGPQDGFFELGGNSLVAIQLVGAVNEALGGRVTLGDLYEGLTPAHLARVAAPPPAEDTPGSAADARRRAESARKRRAHQQRRRTARGQA